MAAGFEGDLIYPNANPLPHTAGYAQACAAFMLHVIESYTPCVFLTGHQLPILPNYSFSCLLAEANQTTEKKNC